MVRQTAGSGPRTGLTLIELAVSATVLAGFLGVPAMLLLSASRAYTSESASSKVSEAARTGVDAIASRLVQSSSTSASVTTVAPDNTSTVDFSRVVAYLAGGPVWGPPERIEFEYGPLDVDDGLDNDGDGLVDEGRVVWIENPTLLNERRVTLIENVPETWPGEVPGNGLDDNGNGLEDEGGLAFDVSGDRITISLTVQSPGPDGQVVTRSLQRTVAFLNNPAP